MKGIILYRLWGRIVVFLGSKAVPDEAARERTAHGFDYVDHEQLAQLRRAVEGLEQSMGEYSGNFRPDD